MSTNLSSSVLIKNLTFTAVAVSLVACNSGGGDSANTNQVIPTFITPNNQTNEPTSEDINSESVVEPASDEVTDNSADVSNPNPVDSTTDSPTSTPEDQTSEPVNEEVENDIEVDPSTDDVPENPTDEQSNDVVDSTTDSSTDTTETDATDSQTSEPAFPADLLDNGTGALYSQAANSALLSGAVVGSSEVPNSSLYRTIPLTTYNMPIDTEIVHAIAYGDTSAATSMIMHLRNSSSEVRCFVGYDDTYVLNAAGAIFANGLLDTRFAEGSVGIVSDGYTGTCVAPGDIVYFDELFIGGFRLDQIARVEISDLSFVAGGSLVDKGIRPISYEAKSNSVGVNSVDVLVANQSSLTLQLKDSKLVILSDEGIPMDAQLTFHDNVMQPGAETVISIPYRFEGSSTNIRVILDYAPFE